MEELLLEAGSDPALRATVSASLAGLLAMQGEADRARSLYADAVAIYEELGLRLRRATRAHIGSRIALLAGDPVAAEDELRTANDVLVGFGAHGIAAVHAGCSRTCSPSAGPSTRRRRSRESSRSRFPRTTWRRRCSGEPRSAASSPRAATS